MNILILIKLIVAHLAADYPFQPNKWIAERNKKHWKSGRLLLHSLIHGSLAWLVIFQWQAWWVGGIIFISHFFIDVWKSYRPEKLRYFVIDQAGHMLILIILWITYTGIWVSVPGFWENVLGNASFWLILLGYIIVLWPIGIIIQQFVQNRFEIPDNDQGLESAGKWIGYFERVLVLTFVLMSAYSALGLLIAAKSILRVGINSKSSRKQTEYILIGTLISWSLAIIIGILLKYLLNAHIN